MPELVSPLPMPRRIHHRKGLQLDWLDFRLEWAPDKMWDIQMQRFLWEPEFDGDGLGPLFDPATGKKVREEGP